MGSSGKKKTTMAKLARENRLRERRLNKQAKRDARRQAPADQMDTTAGSPGEAVRLDTTAGSADEAVQAPQQAGSRPPDPRDKEVALLRLHESPDEVLAVFERKLRDDAFQAGATEQEMRQAQRDHPGHGA